MLNLVVKSAVENVDGSKTIITLHASFPLFVISLFFEGEEDSSH